MRFNITPAASRDMASIADDLADRVGLNSSDRFLQGVTAKIDWLTQFSSMGRRRDDLAPGIRSLNYEKYLIFYRARLKEGFKSIPTEFLNTPDLAGLFHSKFRHFVHPRECAVPGISDFRLRWLKPPKLVA